MTHFANVQEFPGSVWKTMDSVELVTISTIGKSLFKDSSGSVIPDIKLGDLVYSSTTQYCVLFIFG